MMTNAMQQLIDLLPDYTAGKLGEEQREAIEALLNDYIDDTLDAETTAAIDQAAARDKVLADELARARRGKEKLAALFPPADEPLEDPNSPEIQRLLDDLFAEQPEDERSGKESTENRSAKESARTGIVIPFPSLHVLSSERVLQALAASLALVVVGGAVLLSVGVRGVVEEGRLARLALEGQLDQAAAEREAQHARIAALEDEARNAGVATGARLAEAREALAAAQARLAETAGRLEVTQEARADLQRRIAAQALDEQRLQAELARAEEQTSWLAQVAQYHQGYGEQSTAHQVEITADNREELLAWLSGQLGQQVTVPDLDGMNFIGGRLLFANGEPIGQIAYHDEANRLFGYCLTRNDTSEVEAPQRSSFGGLNMVSWSDATTRYVLVGWQPPERIETLVRQLRDS